MARPEGFEPPTFWFVARRSIQLSYERTGSKTILGAGRNLVNAPASVHWRFLSPLVRQHIVTGRDAPIPKAAGVFPSWDRRAEGRSAAAL